VTTVRIWGGREVSLSKPKPDPEERHVLQVIRDYLADGKRATRAEIAKVLHLSEQRTCVYLNRLVAEGSLRRTRAYRKGQGRPPYLYVLEERYDMDALERERAGTLGSYERSRSPK
jgi:predicted ArsR family transcriptional regulator